MNSTYLSLFKSQSYTIDVLKAYSLQSASAVVVGTALYILYSSSKDTKHDGFDKIPMPKGKYPYVGHLPHLTENSFLKMYEWHKDLGKYHSNYLSITS
ncbi:hypothetical protein BDF14DRAFT_912849 [Spinellus fusiger]|nr:hypothetical protein BDF14DRAFT_912849 [Spinellus fusiger]